MITLEVLLRRVGGGLEEPVLRRWIAAEWVRPAPALPTVPAAETLWFEEIDVARVRLILELRDELAVGEDAIPVVLSLIDQLHDARRRMRRLRDALEFAAPDDTARDLLDRLARGGT